MKGMEVASNRETPFLLDHKERQRSVELIEDSYIAFGSLSPRKFPLDTDSTAENPFMISHSSLDCSTTLRFG